MGKLSNKIAEMLTRQVNKRGIVVWYDPEKAYAKLVQKPAGDKRPNLYGQLLSTTLCP